MLVQNMITGGKILGRTDDSAKAAMYLQYSLSLMFLLTLKANKRHSKTALINTLHSHCVIIKLTCYFTLKFIYPRKNATLRTLLVC